MSAGLATLTAMSAIAYQAVTPARRFGALGDSLWVLRQAGVLFGRHWPVLISASLGGVAAHGLLLEAAIRASGINSIAGLLVLVLAPISTLTALVFMLRAIRVSLPYLSSADSSSGVDGSGERRRGLLDFIGRVAVPYLAIYAAYGYMKDDFSTFAYEVWRVEPIHTMDRLPFSPSLGLTSIVVVAVALRFLLGRLSGSLSFAWTALGTYVEVIWVGTLAMGLTSARHAFDDWFDAREVSTWWQGALDHLPGTQLAALLGGWAHVLYENAELVFVAPVAWLIMGAVVYGREVPESKLTDERLLTAAARRIKRMPVLGAVSGTLSSELQRRFGELLGSIRLLGKAGLRPMLLFCVVFVLVQSADAGLWELERLLIGPHDLNDFWWPASYLLSPINTALRYVLLICLLGAATDRILRAQEEADSAKARADQLNKTYSGS
jgi:hypothetical protein